MVNYSQIRKLNEDLINKYNEDEYSFTFMDSDAAINAIDTLLFEIIKEYAKITNNSDLPLKLKEDIQRFLNNYEALLRQKKEMERIIKPFKEEIT